MILTSISHHHQEFKHIGVEAANEALRRSDNLFNDYIDELLAIMTVNDQYPLTTLFPSTPYLLAYALPLFLLSLVLTFAGTFLTLDRTRSFAPHYDAVPGAYERPKKFRFVLEGGAGGLIIGYLFGGKSMRFCS